MLVTFRVSFNKEFGSVSVDSNNEKEIIENIKRLQSLGDKIEEIHGFDIRVPHDIITKLRDLEYVDRVIVLLDYSKKPLSRHDCKKRNKILQIPDSWWNGSNFSRDLKKRAKLDLIQIIEKERPEYKITQKGKNYIKQLLSEK